MDSSAPYLEDTCPGDEFAALDALELDMPALQARARDLFALANAWTERHDAILAATPAASLGVVEARLRRISIRWGMAPGVRITGLVPALLADATSDPQRPR